MDTQEIKDLLNILKNAVSGVANHTQIQQTEEGPELLFTVTSPFDEDGETGCRVSLIPNDSGSVTVEMMLFVFSSIDSTMFSDFDILLNAVNERIVYGSYRLFDDQGMIVFVHSLLLNGSESEKTAVTLIGKTLSAMEETVYRTAGVILSYLGGNTLEEIMNEIDKVEE